MRTPEHIPAQTDDECPVVVRRIFLLAALGSVVLAVLAYAMVRPGLDEVLGLKHDPWGDRDRGVACVAGFTSAIAGLIAAWQGFSGVPKRVARTLATLGLLLNLAVLLGAGIPFLLDYLKRIQG